MVGRIQVVGQPIKKKKKPSVGIQVVGEPITPRTEIAPRPENASVRVKVEGKPVATKGSKGFFGRAFERFKGSQAALKGLKEKGGLKTGTLPIGPGGAIFKGAKGAKDIAPAFRRIPTSADDILTTGKLAIQNLRRLGKKAAGFAIPILTTAYVVNEFLLSPSELATWAAVDNVAGLISFQVKNSVDGVRFGTVTVEDAQLLIQDAKQHIAGARSFVERTTMLNPKLWAGRNTLIGAIDVAENGVLLQEEILAELSDPEATAIREQQAAAFERRNEVLNIRSKQDISRAPADVAPVGENR